MQLKLVFTVIILNVLCHLASAEDKEVEVSSWVPEAKLDSVRSTLGSNFRPPSDTDDPCAPYNPPVPNFWAPGRRVSEVKCAEYVWQLNVRDEREQREQKCKPPLLGIIGGKLTEHGEYPNMAAIGWIAVTGGWIFKCGGTLISPNFVLTAAHCSRASQVDNTVADLVPKIVRLGVKNLENDDLEPIDVKITNIIRHPRHRPPRTYFDIALMKLKEDVRFNKDVQPACLWTHPDVDVNEFGRWLRREVTVTGWGAKDTPELQAAELDVIDSNTCDRLLKKHSTGRKWSGMVEHQLCAGKLSGGVDACRGDSGGPLQVTMNLPVRTQGNMNYVIGVTSFGIGCALPNKPGVYTRVSSFLDWIERYVWPEEYVFSANRSTT